MPTDSYQLFAPGSACNSSLPLNPIADEFLIARFAPLHVRTEEGDAVPAVLPREAVHREVMAAMTAQIESDVPAEALAPAIQGGVPLGAKWRTAPKLAEKGKGRIKVTAGGRGHDGAPSRAAARAAEPDAAPTVAPTELGTSLSELYPAFQFVLYLPYRQTWELLGYSRGELLNSISLGPQEETGSSSATCRCS